MSRQWTGHVARNSALAELTFEFQPTCCHIARKNTSTDAGHVEPAKMVRKQVSTCVCQVLLVLTRSAAERRTLCQDQYRQRPSAALLLKSPQLDPCRKHEPAPSSAGCRTAEDCLDVSPALPDRRHAVPDGACGAACCWNAVAAKVRGCVIVRSLPSLSCPVAGHVDGDKMDDAAHSVPSSCR